MITKKMLWRLSLLFLTVLASGLAEAPAYGQTGSDWWRRQQQQQQQQQQQRQQEAERRARQQEAERQRLREQERQRLQQMERDRLIQRQRRSAANENLQRRPAVNDNVQRRATGVVRLNRPLTAGELRRGFTGKVTQDGHALVKVGDRVVTVPAARVSGRSYGAQGSSMQQPSRWSVAKRNAITAEVHKLAAINLREKVRTGGSGGLSDRFNRASSGGGGRRGGGGRGGGNGGDDDDNNPPGSGGSRRPPKKGDLTTTFNNAARNPPSKVKQDKPTPEPKPKATPTNSPTPYKPKP